jgi:hypothetical protein
MTSNGQLILWYFIFFGACIMFGGGMTLIRYIRVKKNKSISLINALLKLFIFLLYLSTGGAFLNITDKTVFFILFPWSFVGSFTYISIKSSQCSQPSQQQINSYYTCVFFITCVICISLHISFLVTLNLDENMDERLKNIFDSNLFYLSIFCLQSGLSVIFLIYMYVLTNITKTPFPTIQLTEIRVDSDNNDECAICLEKFETIENIDKEDSKNQTIKTNCNHIFHKECIDKHIQINYNYEGKKLTCPMCRSNLVVLK